MKVAKLNSIATQTESTAILNNYYLVDNDYDFEANEAEDVTTEEIINLFHDNMNANYVKGWENSILRNAKDYLYMRDFAKATFIPQWNSLSSDEKKILIKYYIYSTGTTQGDIDSYFTSEEQIINWTNLAAITKGSREIRWEALRKRISFDLTTMQSLQFYQDTKAFKGDYIDANLPHLSLWLTNGSYPALGIDYSATGFSSKTYYTEARRNICVDILINGNY